MKELEEVGVVGEGFEGQTAERCSVGRGVFGDQADRLVAQRFVFHCVNSRKFGACPGETTSGAELAGVSGVDFFEEVGEMGLEVVIRSRIFGEGVEGLGAESVAKAVAAGVGFAGGGDGASGSGSVGARGGNAGGS